MILAKIGLGPADSDRWLHFKPVEIKGGVRLPTVSETGSNLAANIDTRLNSKKSR
jgi:hypothetical protein